MLRQYKITTCAAHTSNSQTQKLSSHEMEFTKILALSLVHIYNNLSSVQTESK
jgi:hypothetical protein